MYFVCMLRLEAYLLDAQQSEWVAGWVAVVSLSLGHRYKKPGGRPVVKADEQEVAEMQHALWCLKNGWREIGKQDHMKPLVTSVPVPRPDSPFTHMAEMGREREHLHHYLCSPSCYTTKSP